MSSQKPISTAPMDGRKVTVVWTDERGVENRSIAQYRSAGQLAGSGGDWDSSDEGWWTFVDDDTQKRIHPESWIPEGDAD